MIQGSVRGDRRPVPCRRWRRAIVRPTLWSLVLAIGSLVAHPVSADRLDDVRERGRVQCGVNTDLRGFSQANSLGEYSGLDVDFCRAVASAIFDDPEAVEFMPLTATERFEALRGGRIDILSRNTTWTLERNILEGEFVGVSFYDGQGFMVKAQSGIRSALELDDVPICVSRGTTTELNAIDFFAVNELRYVPVYFDDVTDAVSAYREDECGALTTDRAALAAQRSGLEEPEAHLILPDVISKEPLGPVVRGGDLIWENIVRWTLNCMINAEEQGITQASVASLSEGAPTPTQQRLLGQDGNLGRLMRLTPDWCTRVIRHVGNYGDSYERNLGTETPLGLERGVNQLWTEGGLLYAPPIR